MQIEECVAWKTTKEDYKVIWKDKQTQEGRIRSPNLKFKHGNWNSRPSNYTYFYFELNFGGLSKIILEQVTY